MTQLTFTHKAGYQESYDLSKVWDDPLYIWIAAAIGILQNLIILVTFTKVQPKLHVKFLFWWLSFRGVEPEMKLVEDDNAI